MAGNTRMVYSGWKIRNRNQENGRLQFFGRVFTLTYRGEHCERVHQGRGEGPHPDAGVSARVPVLDVGHNVPLEGHDQPVRTPLPDLGLEDVRVEGHVPQLTGKLAPEVKCDDGLGHLAVGLDGGKEEGAHHHVERDQRAHADLKIKCVVSFPVCRNAIISKLKRKCRNVLRN